MPTPSELAGLIRDTFPPDRSERLEVVVSELLMVDGWRRNAAADEAAAKEQAVLSALQRFDPRELDFYVAETRPARLVGNNRPAIGESEGQRTLRILGSRETKERVREAVYRLGAERFVGIAARMMRQLGASEAYATGNGDEGGIDLYGRLPLRMQDVGVPRFLVSTTLLEANLLFLAQCKCYDPSKPPLGPSKLDEFNGAVARCVAKYEGQRRKPSKRVPEGFYRTGERAIGVYFTTARYTGGAEDARRDVILVDGLAIGEFLIVHGIGVQIRDGVADVDLGRIQEWADEGLDYRPHVDDGSTRPARS